jgi:ABC-2 type transport system ATP-binding protein
MRCARSTTLLLAACLALAGCTTYHSTAAPERQAAGGQRPARYYQAQLMADDGTLIRFTVYQPALAPGATAPLILHTHGFGLHRMARPHFSLYATFLEPGKAARLAWQRGYWVISYDQRGHGDSGDVAHVLDPAREGRDVTTLLDWATRHLALATVNGDPRVGMLGESYAGGIQGIASALDPRIDAVIPITTWHDLDAALVPNDVPKSAWLTTLILIGELLAELEPDLEMAYRTALEGAMDTTVRARLATHSLAAFCARGEYPAADALLVQGFRDVLFPVNDALAARACWARNGRDVRLIAIEHGHLAPTAQWSPSLKPWHMESTVTCDGRELRLRELFLAWFDAKLKDDAAAAAGIPRFCFTGDPAVDAALRPPDRVPFTIPPVRVGGGASGLHEWLLRPLDRVANLFRPARLPPDWQKARDGSARPARVPLLVADQPTWVAGVPKADLVVSATDRPGAIVFLRLAAWRPGRGSYRVLSQQVTPVRGEGRHQLDLAAVRYRLERDEVLGLLVQVHSNQFRGTDSGLRTRATVEGSLEIPLAAASPLAATSP